ncbi:hypothetical protein BT69DRAFT_1403349, partial [Atractiella rhizophila]
SPVASRSATPTPFSSSSPSQVQTIKIFKVPDNVKKTNEQGLRIFAIDNGGTCTFSTLYMLKVVMLEFGNLLNIPEGEEVRSCDVFDLGMLQPALGIPGQSEDIQLLKQKIEHCSRIPTASNPPHASLTCLTQLLNLPSGSVPPLTLSSVAILRAQEPTIVNAMCGGSVDVSRIGGGGRSVGVSVSGGRGGILKSRREISGKTRSAYENACHALCGATCPGKTAKEAHRAIRAENSARKLEAFSRKVGKGWNMYLWTLSSLTGQLSLGIDRSKDLSVL